MARNEKPVQQGRSPGFSEQSGNFSFESAKIPGDIAGSRMVSTGKFAGCMDRVCRVEGGQEKMGMLSKDQGGGEVQVAGGDAMGGRRTGIMSSHKKGSKRPHMRVERLIHLELSGRKL